ncbi:arylsulfatase [Streptomyces violaceusniger]|uniref:Sulfatase n=1 Tax=Streptomyces violaceusniger (strain Tu 4113) TaxID=653045 RepID=G2P3S2_STRV4|nr:arylsulfatase [Streptomyces violaceusniger]AEM84407.1 sulfatase [Streptomyces violaceusniger Tu 4113]
MTNASPHPPSASGTFQGKIGTTYEESTPWWPEQPAPPEDTPNVVVIVLDDVGFSDLGCFGSDIETPAMDALATGGLRYTNFHTTTLCSPTRASLLTGRNHHSVGMRMLSNFDTGFPSGRGRVTQAAAMLPEVLRDNGFNTMAVGKWHLAPMEQTTASGPYTQWPLSRGFERYYGFLEAETDSFYPELFYDNHAVAPPKTPEEGYHLSEDLVDRAIEFVTDQTSVTPEKPFFMYMAFGAAHAPHQAPQEYLEKYRGRFDHGWDVERETRHARQIERGILPPGTELAPRNPGVEPFDELSDDEQKLSVRLQEAYAAMLDHTDHHIGRFMEFLERIGQLENTITILLSDNGASQEGGQKGSLNPTAFQNGLSEDFDEMLARIDEIGTTRAHANYPWGWAQAGNTPFKRYKQNTHEGGVRCPLIVNWPRGLSRTDENRQQFHHVSDIMPTLFELLDLQAPEVYHGIPQMPIHGTSMAYTLDAPTAPTRKEAQYFEMFGHRAIWHDGWKAVSFHQRGSSFDDDQWELYHHDTDFSECNDLAETQPEQLQKMVARFWVEAGKYDVLPLDDNGFALRAKIPRPGSPRRRTTFTYYPGMAHLPGAAVPPVMNRAHRITAFVDRAAASDEGVLVSLGNISSGYVLYVKDNRLVYEYNFLGTRYTVTSQDELPLGPAELTFDFIKTGDVRGVGRLYVSGMPAGKTDLPQVLPHFFGWQGLDVGRDTLSPSSPSYDGEFAFAGKLDRVVFDVAPDEEGTEPFERVD